jgi:hypothetical protein
MLPSTTMKCLLPLVFTPGSTQHTQQTQQRVHSQFHRLSGYSTASLGGSHHPIQAGRFLSQHRQLCMTSYLPSKRPSRRSNNSRLQQCCAPVTVLTNALLVATMDLPGSMMRVSPLCFTMSRTVSIRSVGVGRMSPLRGEQQQ